MFVQSFYSSSSLSPVVVVAIVVILIDLYSQYMFTITNVYHFLWFIVSSYNSGFLSGFSLFAF